MDCVFFLNYFLKKICLCFALIACTADIADDRGASRLEPHLILQEVFHEEVFRHTIYSIFWNEELFSTQRTRHLVSWIFLCRCSGSIQALKAECVNAW